MLVRVEWPHMKSDVPFRRWKMTARGAAVFIVIFMLLSIRPALFSDILRGSLALIVHALDPEYRLDRIGQDNIHLKMEGMSFVLNRVTMTTGSQGPEYGFTAKHLFSVINVYPLIILTVIAAWPMSWRRRGCALGIGLILAAAAAALDCAVMFFWCGRELYDDVWRMIAPHVSHSAGNDAATAMIGREFARLKVIKSFFSTGGRQFLTVLLALISCSVCVKRARPRSHEEDSSLSTTRKTGETAESESSARP